MIEVTGESQEVNTSVASEKTPYSVVTLEAFDKSFPEHTTDLGYILDGIDRQLVNNYTQQESHIFPGVFFPMSSVFVSCICSSTRQWSLLCSRRWNRSCYPRTTKSSSR